MWQHSIAEEASSSLAWFTGKQNKAQALNMLATAQTFFFGESSTEAMKNILEKDGTLFYGKNSVDMKLPYFGCIFEYTLDEDFFFAKKAAAYVHQVSDQEIMVITMAHVDKKWQASPINYVINATGTDIKSRKISNVKMTEDERADQENIDRCILGFVNISMMLLCCKNISTEIVLPDEKLNKSRKRKKKLPMMEYKVLNVSLPGGGNRTDREANDPIDHNRVHLCRGHFKEYNDEKPLFGKIIGRFWWQPHARGRGDGVVLKDYNCKINGAQ